MNNIVRFITIPYIVSSGACSIASLKGLREREELSWVSIGKISVKNKQKLAIYASTRRYMNMNEYLSHTENVFSSCNYTIRLAVISFC